MIPLAPLESLFDAAQGDDLPLPPDLSALYGPLRFPAWEGRPYVIGNFVTTLDGVASLSAPGLAGGGPISGSNPHDRMVMGLLRSVADAVIVGAGTLRSVPRHLWTAEYIFPALAGSYRALRAASGKSEPPLNVIVTARGEIDPDLPVFRSGEVKALIVTTPEGALSIRERGLSGTVGIEEVKSSDRIGARAILTAIGRVRPGKIFLVEGGPQLMGDFFAERCLNELFLTLAPQVAGRDGTVERPGFVAGKRFAPERPLWGTLAGAKRGGSHLFLRYAFSTEE
ncbi:MAG TPA: dihydrofolate reductase family protein [Candidatus Limnocylindrales bacterium]|nr:dihydrofolate reductase family protein [Candidatus Limnocylindrales bacterium]